jgi:hypothetical protein
MLACLPASAQHRMLQSGRDLQVTGCCPGSNSTPHVMLLDSCMDIVCDILSLCMDIDLV